MNTNIAAKRKIRKTRKKLDQIRKQSRKITNSDETNKHKNCDKRQQKTKKELLTLLPNITSNRLTLGNTVISKTITRSTITNSVLEEKQEPQQSTTTVPCTLPDNGLLTVDSVKSVHSIPKSLSNDNLQQDDGTGDPKLSNDPDETSSSPNSEEQCELYRSFVETTPERMRRLTPSFMNSQMFVKLKTCLQRMYSVNRDPSADVVSEVSELSDTQALDPLEYIRRGTGAPVGSPSSSSTSLGSPPLTNFTDTPQCEYYARKLNQ